MAIRGVLWDFGGVITTSPFDAFLEYERSLGVPEGLIRGINATNPDTNAWAQLERSEVDLDQFCVLFETEASELGHTLEGRRVLACLGGRVRPDMAEAVRRCAERLVCACLTNNFAGGGLMADETRKDEVQAVQAHFHHIIESSKIGLRKPDPRVYRLACDTMGVGAGRGGLPRRPRRQPEAGRRHGHDHDQGRGPHRGAAPAGGARSASPSARRPPDRFSAGRIAR